MSAAILKALLQSFEPKKVVLYGPMESGKTTLLHTLEGFTPPHGTVSSMKPTEAVVTLPVSLLLVSDGMWSLHD